MRNTSALLSTCRGNRLGSPCGRGSAEAVSCHRDYLCPSDLVRVIRGRISAGIALAPSRCTPGKPGLVPAARVPARVISAREVARTRCPTGHPADLLLRPRCDREPWRCADSNLNLAGVDRFLETSQCRAYSRKRHDCRGHDVSNKGGSPGDGQLRLYTGLPSWDQRLRRPSRLKGVLADTQLHGRRGLRD